jgi:hypothetical protein
MTIGDEVQQAIEKTRRWTPRTASFMCGVKLLKERGGLPQAPGEPLRPDYMRVREIDVQLDYLSEMIPWDPNLAQATLFCLSLRTAIMLMKQERGYYEGPFGKLRYEADMLVQRRIDLHEGVRR